MSILSALSPQRAAQPLTNSTPRMVDLAFALKGECLPHDYAFALGASVLAALPWMAEDAAYGIHPIRAAWTEFGLLLSRRARLVLRIPDQRVMAARQLCGRQLQIGATPLLIGAATLRPIAPFATLRSWNVATTALDDQGFIDEMAGQLAELGVKAQLISDKPQLMEQGGQTVAGFGLLLYELSPAHSLLLQSEGLGAHRQLGCGIFVQHKIITGLGAEPD